MKLARILGQFNYFTYNDIIIVRYGALKHHFKWQQTRSEAILPVGPIQFFQKTFFLTTGERYRSWEKPCKVWYYYHHDFDKFFELKHYIIRKRGVGGIIKK